MARLTKKTTLFSYEFSHIIVIASNRTKELRNVDERFIFLLRLILRNELKEGERKNEKERFFSIKRKLFAHSKTYT